MRLDNGQTEVRIVVVSPPGEEPVTLAELKLHARIDLTDDDDLLAGLITAAREWVEQHTARRLMLRTETLFLDDFPDCDRIVIPVAPIAAIGAVTYLDQDDAASTVDATTITKDTNGPIGIVALKTGQTWPALTSSKRPANAVRVAFTSGYPTAAAVPSSLKLAVKLLAAHLYENREATAPIEIREVPLGIHALLKPWRVWEGLV